ncbi:MAG: hypothetical protein WC471_04520 [Candidatus Woesearchaeota archaeon]
MENEELGIPAIVLLILVLIFKQGLKFDANWSFIIGLIGFVITFLILRGKK